MSIVITGASGQLGRLVAESLLEHVDASELVLVSRRPTDGARLLDSPGHRARTRAG